MRLATQNPHYRLGQENEFSVLENLERLNEHKKPGQTN
jgi:hypothetical protein